MGKEKGNPARLYDYVRHMEEPTQRTTPVSPGGRLHAPYCFGVIGSAVYLNSCLVHGQVHMCTEEDVARNPERRAISTRYWNPPNLQVNIVMSPEEPYVPPLRRLTYDAVFYSLLTLMISFLFTLFLSTSLYVCTCVPSPLMITA